MRVSILINNYNYGQFVARAIESALDQTMPAHEVVVVDDGSTDGSRDIIAVFGDRIRTVFKDNGGQASCFNAGFAASSGDVICLLDADDYFLPEKLARLNDIYSTDDSLGWCFHSLRRENLDGESVGDEIVGIDGRLDLRQRVRRGSMRNATPATTALSFKRTTLDKLLPMPSAPGVAVGDHYLKLGAVALAPGYMSQERLAVQQIHSLNRYTGKANTGLKAEILVRTATALRDAIPDAVAYTDNLAGTAAALAGAQPGEVRSLLDRYRKGSTLIGRARIAAWQTIKSLRRK